MDINRLLKENNIEISQKHVKKLSDYADILVRENKKYNVASIKDTDSFFEKTLVDSLIIQRCKKIELKGELLDVGSGNGFPGIVLSICYPDLKVTLLDAEKKKIRFLEKVKEELKLNLNIEHHRAEEYLEKKKEYFDIVCAKALVSKPNKWLKWTIPFAKKGGIVINYKTEKFLDELNLSSSKKILSRNKAVIYESLDYSVSNSNRTIVVLKKMKSVKT